MYVSNQHTEFCWRYLFDEPEKLCLVRRFLFLGVPTPALSSALSFYDGYRNERLPANLLQAQRDYFGAHTYELLGQEGKFVHTNWTGKGGNVSASTYDV